MVALNTIPSKILVKWVRTFTSILLFVHDLALFASNALHANFIIIIFIRTDCTCVVFYQGFIIGTIYAFFTPNIINLIQGAYHAFSRLWIVVLRMEAFKTFLPVPVAFSRTFALLCFLIENLVRDTRLTQVEDCVEILFFRARNALCTVENGGWLWTWFTFMDTQVIDLILWTLITYLSFVIKIIGKETLNALSVFG